MPPKASRPRSKGRPHQRLRHRNAIPPVPRDEREAAMERLRVRHPVHAAGLMVVARGCAREAARKLDAFVSLTEWATATRAVATKIHPPPSMPGELFWRLDDGSMMDVSKYIDHVRGVGVEFLALLDLGSRLHHAYQWKAGWPVELLRDVDLMAGAGALRYAETNNFRLTSQDLADLGIAIGLDRHDADGGALDSRWRKRMKKLKIIAEQLGPIKVEEPASRWLGEEFFGPL